MSAHRDEDSDVARHEMRGTSTPTAEAVSVDEVVRLGLRAMLEADARTQRDTGRRVPAADAAQQVERRVQVVLYDVIGLEHGHTQVLDGLVGDPRVVVMAVTREERPELTDRALRRGADGCIPLRSTSREVGRAVSAALGGLLGGDGSLGSVDYTVNPVRRDEVLDTLSKREVQVLQLISAGFRNAVIADELYLSENTVKTYVRSAYRKIGTSTRSQAIVWGLHHKIEHHVWSPPDAVDRPGAHTGMGDSGAGAARRASGTVPPSRSSLTAVADIAR